MLKSDVEIRLAKLAEVSADNARLEAMLDRQAGEIVDPKMEVRRLNKENDWHARENERHIEMCGELEERLAKRDRIAALIAKLKKVEHGPA